MIEVKNLVKKYGDHAAVDDLSFTVETGKVIGFLGPNGAGKSTTMNIITGYIAPTSGEVLVNGIDVNEEPEKAKKHIGYLPEIPPLYPDLRVREYLTFVAELKKVERAKRDVTVHKIMGRTGTLDVSERLIKNLSKGYRQRVGLAQALVGNPPILILDEPTVGLDPKQMMEIRNLIKRLGKRHTVILSSHILSEIQAVCDRVIIINKGKLMADGAIDTLAQSMSQNHRLKVRLDGAEADVLQALRAIPDVAKVQQSTQLEAGLFDYEIEPKNNADLRKAVNAVAQEHGWNIYRMESGLLTLEDIFLKVTMGEWTPEQTKTKPDAAPKKPAPATKQPDTKQEEAK